MDITDTVEALRPAGHDLGMVMFSNSETGDTQFITADLEAKIEKHGLGTVADILDVDEAIATIYAEGGDDATGVEGTVRYNLATGDSYVEWH